jgi:hypothetical protein
MSGALLDVPAPTPMVVWQTAPSMLPGRVGTPFAGWSKGAIQARANAAAAADTSPAPIVPWSIHDLRRTVATGLQRLGIRFEVTEAVLNHIRASRASQGPISA